MKVLQLSRCLDKSAFNSNEFLFRQSLLNFFLWDLNTQDAVFKFCLDVFLCKFFTHEETAAQRARITLLTDNLSGLLVRIKSISHPKKKTLPIVTLP